MKKFFIFAAKKVYAISTILFFCFICGCASTSARVMPLENNVNRVVARGTYKDETVEKAIDTAKEYCDARKKGIIYLKDNTNYEGYMSEGTKKGARQLSKAATFTGLGLGAVNTSLGSVVSGAGIAGLFMTDDKDYVAEVEFRCQ
jgi:hypothetical protein